MFWLQPFRFLIIFALHAQPAVPPHTKPHNHAQPGAMAPHSPQPDEAPQAIHSMESSIADCQDQDDVAEEKENQMDLRYKL